MRQYWLGGTASGEVEPTDFNFASSLKAATIPGGGMAGTFTTQPLPIESNLTALPLIFASGAVYSNGRLRCGSAAAASVGCRCIAPGRPPPAWLAGHTALWAP